MVDVLLHMLGGAGIFLLGSFFLPAVPFLSPLSGFAIGAIYGLLREQAQHGGGGFFDFSWITPARFLEGVAWGLGAAVIAVVLVFFGALVALAVLMAVVVAFVIFGLI